MQKSAEQCHGELQFGLLSLMKIALLKSWGLTGAVSPSGSWTCRAVWSLCTPLSMEWDTTMCSWPSKPLDSSPPSQCLSRKIQIQTSLLSNAQTPRKESLCWYFWLLLPQVSVGKHKLRERAGRACFQLCSCGQSMGFEFTGSEMEVGRLWVYLLLHFVVFVPSPPSPTRSCHWGLQRRKMQKWWWPLIQMQIDWQWQSSRKSKCWDPLCLSAERVLGATECPQKVARHRPSIHSFP